MPLRPLPPTAAGTLASQAWIDALYLEYKQSPDAVPENWRWFFQGFELSMCGRECVAARKAGAQSRVAALIEAYRRQGHLQAHLDPLGTEPGHPAALSLEAWGLKDADLNEVFDVGSLRGVPPRAPLKDVLAALEATYCGSVGVEYAHIQDPRIRSWLQDRMETTRNRPRYDAAQKREILARLVDAEVFETFLHTRYRGQKRFSLEGAETLIAALHALVERAPDEGVEEMVLGMAHRGRLNVLANILDLSYASIFAEFEGASLPDQPWGSGDVKYHRGANADHVNRNGRSLHLTLAANPSHLETVGPVVEGSARARQRRRGDTAQRRKVIPVVLHGDAAFAGQGIVAETFNLSALEGYRTGGTIHLVVNNQIGFTTRPEESRSTPYATDVAKVVEAPVFHVNGDDPEAACFVTELALQFRQTFGRDVVVDLICYRRHGHNEGDEPEFTHPALYRRIKARPPVRRVYLDRLLQEGVVTPQDDADLNDQIRARLEGAWKEVQEAMLARGSLPAAARPFDRFWKGIEASWRPLVTPTGVPHERLLDVARALTTIPTGFQLHPKIARSLPDRLAQVRDRGTVDWATAELLALGTLLAEGTPARLSGQDSARGTFSQRHAVWYDMETEAPYTPLSSIHPGQARLCVYNSSLSEASVLAFDYGYSLADPSILVLWEAQFGDFANGAQVVIDTFLTCALSRWQRASGLTLLLPHGYEGQGPDHSDAHLERWLAACAEDNLQVVVPTTPAQHFHLLRRQVHQPFRLPLVVFTPKSLLRLPACRSAVTDLEQGQFQEVLANLPQAPSRVLFCTGKVYYDLLEKCPADVGLVRLEQLYPWPGSALEALAPRLEQVSQVAWVQEEPENRGAGSWVRPRLARLLHRHIPFVGRPPGASPATGSLKIHRQEQEALVRQALLGSLT